MAWGQDVLLSTNIRFFTLYFPAGLELLVSKGPLVLPIPIGIQEEENAAAAAHVQDVAATMDAVQVKASHHSKYCTANACNTYNERCVSRASEDGERCLKGADLRCSHRQYD